MVIMLGVVVAVVLGSCFLAFNRKPVEKFTPEQIADRLLRQPDRFFIIVPWLLHTLRISGDYDIDDFIKATAECWRKKGEFDKKAQCLLAFANLHASSSAKDLRRLLSLLFDPTDSPIVIDSLIPGGNCSTAVECLRACHNLCRAMENGARVEKSVLKDVAKKTEAAKSHVRSGSVLAYLLGYYNDANILDQWQELHVLVELATTWQRKCTKPSEKRDNSPRSKKHKRGHTFMPKPDAHDFLRKGDWDPSLPKKCHLWFLQKTVMSLCREWDQCRQQKTTENTTLAHT